MQQRGDCLIFVAAILEYQAADAHQVGDIRDGRPLPRLKGMQLDCIRECIGETIAEDWIGQRIGLFVHEGHRTSDT